MEALQGIQYFAPGSYTLFPNWPESRATEIVALLSITIFVLLMPKVLGATLALVKPELRRGYGGTLRLLGSVLVEQVFSTLLAPSMMIFHTTFVITTLAGHPVTWNSQERGDRGIGFLESLDRHKWQILLGLAWGAAIILMAPKYIWWMTPILAGLILSAPLTMLTSRASVGRWMRRRGLLLTPEETNTPDEWVALERRLALGAPDPGKRSAPRPSVRQPIAVPAAAPRRMGTAAEAPSAVEPSAVDDSAAVEGEGAQGERNANQRASANPTRRRPKRRRPRTVSTTRRLGLRSRTRLLPGTRKTFWGFSR
jgi:membrane glycosyltransferase